MKTMLYELQSKYAAGFTRAWGGVSICLPLKVTHQLMHFQYDNVLV